jgi:hypothetical protein
MSRDYAAAETARAALFAASEYLGTAIDGFAYEWHPSHIATAEALTAEIKALTERVLALPRLPEPDPHDCRDDRRDEEWLREMRAADDAAVRK